jgi:heme/copper-type cytochrome/quinol oxidase subunit 3
MLALPPAPAPAPRRQLFVGTALASAAAAAVFASMLAVWWRFREAAGNRDLPTGGSINAWRPKNIVVPQVPSNIMMFTLILGCVMVQFAVWAAKRDERANVGIALAVTAVLTLAAINAQAVIYGRMGMGVTDGAFQTLFYAISGAFIVLLVLAFCFNLITAFRVLGGRMSDRMVISSLALFWYAITVVFLGLWFVIYVTK